MKISGARFGPSPLLLAIRVMWCAAYTLRACLRAYSSRQYPLQHGEGLLDRIAGTRRLTIPSPAWRGDCDKRPGDVNAYTDRERYDSSIDHVDHRCFLEYQTQKDIRPKLIHHPSAAESGNLQ